MQVKLIVGNRTEVESQTNDFIAGLAEKKLIDVKFHESNSVFSVLILFRV